MADSQAPFNIYIFLHLFLLVHVCVPVCVCVRVQVYCGDVRTTPQSQIALTALWDLEINLKPSAGPAPLPGEPPRWSPVLLVLNQ